MLRRSVLLLFALLGIAVLLAIVEYFPLPERTHFWDSAYDTGHILVFGLLSVLLFVIALVFWGQKWLLAQYCFVVSGSLAIGIGVEIWQKFHDRSAELIDVFNDSIGIAAFAILFATVDPRWEEPRTGLLRRGRLVLLASLLLLIGFTPFLRVAHQYQTRRRAFPTIIDFSQPWEDRFYYSQSGSVTSVAPPEDWPAQRRPPLVGRLDLNESGHYPGIVMHEPQPNWSRYDHLELDLLYRGKETRHFALRVHDVFHNNKSSDRYNKELLVKPGFQSIRIPMREIEQGPLLRDLSLQNVSGWALYTTNLSHPETIFIGNVRLAK